MERPVERIIIVGGGTAGWLAAAYLAARSPKLAARPPSITLIAAPDIPTVGVGEGSWPTLRETLATIGIGEAEFMLACDGSFKQGYGSTAGATAAMAIAISIRSPRRRRSTRVSWWRRGKMAAARRRSRPR